MCAKMPDADNRIFVRRKASELELSSGPRCYCSSSEAFALKTLKLQKSYKKGLGAGLSFLKHREVKSCDVNYLSGLYDLLNLLGRGFTRDHRAGGVRLYYRRRQ